MSEEGSWDVVVSSLQDVCNANESQPLDQTFSTAHGDDEGEIIDLKNSVLAHKDNLETAKRLLDTALTNVISISNATYSNADKKGKIDARLKRGRRFVLFFLLHHRLIAFF